MVVLATRLPPSASPVTAGKARYLLMGVPAQVPIEIEIDGRRVPARIRLEGADARTILPDPCDRELTDRVETVVLEIG